MSKFQRIVTQEMIDRFGEVLGTYNPIHHDRAFAIARGFRDCVAFGLQNHAFVSEFMSVRFGSRWFERGRLSTHFVAPTYPGDVMTVDARAIGQRPTETGVELVLEVWCENQSGERVLTGEAVLGAVPEKVGLVSDE